MDNPIIETLLTGEVPVELELWQSHANTSATFMKKVERAKVAKIPSSP
jgi:hypothetical protein